MGQCLGLEVTEKGSRPRAKAHVIWGELDRANDLQICDSLGQVICALVCLDQGKQVLDLGACLQVHEQIHPGSRAEPVVLSGYHVPSGRCVSSLLIRLGQSETTSKGLGQPCTGAVVSKVVRLVGFRSQGFAQVVAQAHPDLQGVAGKQVHDAGRMFEQGMFMNMARTGRDGSGPGQFPEPGGQGFGLVQDAQETPWVGGCTGLEDFLAHSFRCKAVQGPSLSNPDQERLQLTSHREVRQVCSQSGSAKDSDRVLKKIVIFNLAQDFGLQVVPGLVQGKEIAMLILSQSVDGQVPCGQVRLDIRGSGQGELSPADIVNRSMSTPHTFGPGKRQAKVLV